MYRVVIAEERGTSIERVFQAPCEVRKFVQRVYKKDIDVHRMTEILLCILHQKHGCFEVDGLRITWEE